MFKRVIQRRIEGRFLAGFDDELPKSFARRRRSKFSIAMSSRVSRAGNATILRAAMRTAGLLSDSTHVNAPSRKRRTELSVRGVAMDNGAILFAGDADDLEFMGP